MHLDSFHRSPFLSPHHPFLFSLWVSFLCSCLLFRDPLWDYDLWIYPLQHGGLTSGYTTEDRDSPFLSICPEPVVSQRRVRPYKLLHHPWLTVDRPRLVRHSAGNHSSYEVMNAVAVSCPEDVWRLFCHLAFTSFLLPPLRLIQGDIEGLYRAERSIVTYSHYLEQPRTSAFTAKRNINI